MKNILLLFLIVSVAISCKKDDLNDVINPVNNVVYNLTAVSGSNIGGQIQFTRNEDNSTTVFIRLLNPSGLHPASIHHKTREEGGERAITLNTCECEESITEVAELDDGSAISFDGLRNFDGHVNIYLSETQNDVIVSQANIGSNKD